MTEQITNPEPAANQQPPAAPAVTPAPTSAATEKTGGKVYTEAEVESLLKDRLDRERAKREKAAQEAADKAAADAAAKNGEWQKLAEQREKELAQIQAQLRAREIADLKRAAAEKVGLPAALASRLVGETEKDLETDAKALLDTLPKPPAPEPQTPTPKPNGMQPANPGANGSAQETQAQMKARLFGSPVDLFNPATARNLGGGGFITSKE